MPGMKFSDCMKEAVDVGAVSRDEADELIRKYDSHVEAAKGTADPRGAEGVAKDTLERELSEEAARKKRLADLQGEAVDRLAGLADSYLDTKGRPDVLFAFLGALENRNNALIGAPSAVGRNEALIGYAHGRLHELLYETRRKGVMGKRTNKARLENIVDEAYGQGANDPAAKAFLDAWRTVDDEFLDRFNAAGGDIKRMEGYFPQPREDMRLLAQMGEQGWKNLIKPKLDVAKMVDPLTGTPISPARLDEALGVVWRRKVTDGAIDRQPGGAPYGRGALANQRADKRFLVFKDGAAWRDYAAAVGDGDIHAAMMDHLHGMAKDIAMLETLGPNPNSTVEWMKQVVDQEAQKVRLGQPSLFQGKPAADAMGHVAVTDRIDRLWAVMNAGQGVGNMNVADAMQATRNFLTAANLGGAAVTAVVGDPFQQKWARAFAGVSQMRWFADLPAQLLSGASKQEALRAGIVFQDAMEHLNSDLRAKSFFASSAELSRFLPDRVFQWSGLTPWTNAHKRAQAMSFMFETGDRAGQSLADIAADGTRGDRFARFLQGFGIDEAQWDVIRKAKALEHGEAGGLLRPMDVIDSAPGDAAVFDTAMRYSEALHAFMEETVPAGTKRMQAALGKGTKPGTLSGELARSMSMYLSYPATTLTSLLRATSLELMDGNLRGGGFLASTVIGSTIAGALMLQIAELRKGRDPRAMLDEGKPDLKFWGQALAKGGALGFWGDYLMADMDRGPMETAARFAGPVGGLIAETAGVILPVKLLAGEDANRGKAAARFGQRYTPGQNMWFLRPATERIIWDRLQLLADPEAQRAWQRAERKLSNESGQGVWLGKGDMTPRRPPDLSTVAQ